MNETKEPETFSKEKLKYAAKHTGKWLIPPVIFAIIFIIAAKFGWITKDTNNWFSYLLNLIVVGLMDIPIAVAELLFFIYFLFVFYIGKVPTGYSLMKIGISKVVFALSMTPVAYSTIMLFSIDYIPPIKLAPILGLVGYLEGFLILLLLPIKPSHQNRKNINK